MKRFLNNMRMLWSIDLWAWMGMVERAINQIPLPRDED